jgi:hypothetical protein
MLAKKRLAKKRLAKGRLAKGAVTEAGMRHARACPGSTRASIAASVRHTGPR